MNKCTTKIKLRYGVLEDGVYKKTVSGSRHFLRKPPAISLEVSDIEGIQANNGHTIEITDIETGKVYSVEFANFDRHASEPFNRGYGWQRFLTFSHWTVTLDIESKAAKRGEVKRKPGNGERVRTRRDVTAASPRQLLFKGML